MQVLEFPRWDEYCWMDGPAMNGDPNLQWLWIGYQARHVDTFRLTTKDDESSPGLPDGVHKAVRISKCSHVVAADILSGRSPWDYQGKSRSGGLGRGYFVVGKVWDPVMILSSWQQAFASLVWFSWILERKTSAFGWALGFPCVSQIFRCAAQEIHDLQL